MEVPGLHRARLSEADVLLLLDAFRDADFYSLQDESDLLVTDAPLFSIKLSVDGHSRAVEDRLGQSKAFRTLMDRILEISHAQIWLQPTPDTLRAILADSKNLNSTDDEGRSVLMWACQDKSAAAVHELIRSGADVRAKDRKGRTVLMYATARQSPEIVDALLHSNASVNEEDSSGETALHFAAGLASFPIDMMGERAGYDEPPTANFWPTIFPTNTPKPAVIRLLLAAGADANAVDFEGATPLMYAAEVGMPEVLRALLKAGADPDVQDAEGRTALMYAADHCQTDSVRLLVHVGADVTPKDTSGHTALGRVSRNIPESRGGLCVASQKEIIRILQVAQTNH